GYGGEPRIVNRSSCASGNGYVPSYSIGFCVAMTMNGGSSGYVTPSTDTCRSSMHSSSAACVFGDARFTSSTSRRFANTGPGRNSNSFRSEEHTSELQSLTNLVCRLLLEKKNTQRADTA